MFHFELTDLQSIQSVVIEFEDSDIVAFVGDNSNGKSILMKALETITSGDILVMEKREALIRDGCEAGSLLIRHNEKQLGVLIKKERKETCFIYMDNYNNRESAIVRFLGEDGYDKLLYDFGFRVYDKGNICLQIYPTYGAIPFVSTSGKSNNEIIADITVDKVADEFIKSFSTITYPTLKTRIKSYKDQISKYEALLGGVKFYDYQAYGSLASRLRKIYNATDKYIFYRVKDLDIIPCTNMPILNDCNVPNPVIIKTGPIKEHVRDLSEYLNSYLKLQNGICPTCGKRIEEN